VQFAQVVLTVTLHRGLSDVELAGEVLGAAAGRYQMQGLKSRAQSTVNAFLFLS
jgi:hypothetical protein